MGPLASPRVTVPTTSLCSSRASYGVAYHAKPKARAAANGAIDRGDLTDVLRLLGLAEGEWV
jgi:hypothetical protein